MASTRPFITPTSTWLRLFAASYLAVFVSCQLMSSTMTLVSDLFGPLCAADRATTVFQARSLIDCQQRCTTQKNKCYASNFYNDTKTCELYNFKPTTFTSSRKNCKLFTNIAFFDSAYSSTIQASGSSSCSFPYTYNGQLYYECTVFNSTNGTLDIGCYSTGGMKSYDPSKCYDVGSNIALNQPAYQYSTYLTAAASNAVDGNVDTLAFTAAVADSPSWWSVDLSRPYNVIMINVIDDPTPYWFFRMAYFYTWLSNTQPTVGQPLNTSKCSLCRQYSGTFSATQLTGNVTCQLSLTKFRYVILQTSQPNTAMGLAEVQVYAGFVPRTVNVSIPTTANSVPLMSINGWLTIMSHVNSNFPAALNWTMYKNGFGDISSNFWLGLEYIFQLTNVNITGGRMYRLRFELQSNASKRWYSEEYDWFYIESEAQFYKLHVSLSEVGDAGDSLNSPLDPVRAANGMSFSSQDVDNDLFSGNCAKVYGGGGGWWYNRCSNSKQLGISGASYVWGTLNPSEKYLMASRMMIKSNN